MIGDMNTTPWSASMRRAAAIGVRRATGLTPTWPAVVGSTVLIPIDHVLASPHWTVVARKRGPHIGSDHRPVVVSLALRPD
jgi:endonuclease/exonuclease/phosphatase (EEP) superfamily protein YafD